MARPQSPPILAQLRSARTVPEQAAALRALKNDIVGHVQKKEQWIAHGVLQPIVRTISSEHSPAKMNGKGSHTQFCSRSLSEEDGSKLQALQLLASFAHGGPAFLAPIHASQAMQGIMSNISPYANPPQIVVAALQALTDVADAAALADPSSPISTQYLAELILAPEHLDSFNAILSISSSKHLLQRQVTLACGLIYRLCAGEKQQGALTAAGVLDSLAARLASFAVAQGFVVPGAREAAEQDGLSEAFPPAAPENAKLAPVLEAIAAILGDSKYRATRLACVPAILAVFPSIKFDPTRAAQNGRLDPSNTSLSDSRNLDLSAMEYVLPVIPIPSTRLPSGILDRSDSGRSSHGKSTPASQWETESSRLDPPASSESEDVESPLIPWLVHLVRSQGDYERLMAASVLTCLHKAGLGSKDIRETSIGFLVMPLLMQMIVKNNTETPVSEIKNQAMRRKILEQAPLTLARLIVDCEHLQKVASDCHAVSTLTKLLRRSYKPLDVASQPGMWSPHPDTDMDVEGTSPISQLGERGQDEVLAHQIRLRESTLKAISALATGKEEYRINLSHEDFTPYLVESLSEFPKKPRSPKDKSKDKAEDAPTTVAPEYGRNTLPVIIAACQVVRAMSRSISFLRTHLVDHGLALPVFQFLTHPDIDVQNAATATMANLVIEVSPVRELLTEKGVMAILCEHAHSDNPSLRLNALWALKHLVDAVGKDLKRTCLEELESGWLVQLICDDTQDAALNGSRAKDSAADDMDEDVDPQVQDDSHRWQCGNNGDIQELDAANSTRMRQAEDKLNAIREMELNPVRRARNDDVAIQEQGLDFIRNLIGRPDATFEADSPDDTTEMIDYLFNELGQDRLFDILASKLRPKYLNAFSRRAPVAGCEPRVIYPSAQIVKAVAYILVHMAASDPRHRQLVVAQKELMRLLLQHAPKHKESRVALCHLAINLTVDDDESNNEGTEGCRRRTELLKKMGFRTKLEMFEHDDRDLDVRERAKMATFQMDKASSVSY